MTSTVSVLILLALKEFADITPVNGAVHRDMGLDILAVITGAGLPFILYLDRPDLVLPYLVCAVFIFFSSRVFSGGDFPSSVAWVGARTLGMVYVALPLSHFIPLSSVTKGRLWLLFLLAVVWLNDTCAYYTGSTLGRHKLSPIVSPKKTVEGAIGGAVGGVVAAYLFNLFFDMGLAIEEVVFISVLLSAVSLMGDLSESLLKRGAGVKDSGSIIPGHGGVLDRIDGIIFSVPALYYYITWRGIV